jgi:hypothetical protein
MDTNPQNPIQNNTDRSFENTSQPFDYQRPIVRPSAEPLSPTTSATSVPPRVRTAY